MKNFRQMFLYTGMVIICVSVNLPHRIFAQPSVNLIMKPRLKTITPGKGPEKIILKARTSGEVDFLWELNGPGAFEGDATTRELLYIPPQAVPADMTEVIISVTVSDTRGESASDHVNLRLALPSGDISPTANPTPQVPPNRKTSEADNLYVVIMGVEEYQDEKIASIPFARHDAQALYDTFIDPNVVGVPEEQVKLLLDSDFTERNIKRTLGKWLSERLTEDDALLLYYTGYQAQEDEQKYWLTFDAESDDLFSTAISEADLAEMLDRLNMLSILSFFDTAKFFLKETSEETAIPDERTPIRAFRIFSSEGERAFIQASDGTAFSARLAEEQHGEFSALLVKALQGDAISSEGAGLTSAELLSYIERQMEKNAEVMRPVQSGEFERELVLIAGKTEEKEKKNIDAGENTDGSGDENDIELPANDKERIIEIYRNGDISAEQFKKALYILKSEETDQILNDFLEGEIPLDLFKDIF